jgi:hypothetical protein
VAVELEGDAPLVTEEVQVAVGGADRDLELAGDVGGLRRAVGAELAEGPEQAP